MRIRQNISKNFLKTIATRLVPLAALIIALPFVPTAVAHAADISPGGLPKASADKDNVQTILNIVFGIIGAFALLNITLSGLKYITAAGDPQKTSEAKNGIVFSLIGLVIAISATAIVAFVVHRA